MQISPVDPTDADAWASWHATYLASDTFGRPRANPWRSREMLARVSVPSNSEQHRAFAGIEAGRVVATGWLQLLLKDNLDLGLIDVHVLPDERRRGLGTAMLQHLESLSVDAGRRTGVIETSYPFDGAPDGAGSPGAEFLRARGYAFSLGSTRRDLDLPTDAGRLGLLRSEAEPFHAGYGFRQFEGACPDDIVEELGILTGKVATEAPMGELLLEEEVFDVERMREEEAMLVASGRRRYTTVAVAADGTLAGYSDLVVATEDPGKVYQWGTLVAPDHRGHRLGMAVKVRNLELLQSEEPGLTSLSTYNADDNEQMVAINERLGFRPVERLGEFQKRL